MERIALFLVFLPRWGEVHAAVVLLDDGVTKK